MQCDGRQLCGRCAVHKDVSCVYDIRPRRSMNCAFDSTSPCLDTRLPSDELTNPTMADAPRTIFRDFLELSGLMSYEPELLSEGFDDVPTLLDMKEDDLAEMGIEPSHWETLQRARELTVGPNHMDTVPTLSSSDSVADVTSSLSSEGPMPR